MNVVFEVKSKEFVVDLPDAKKILNNVYQSADQLYINGEKILVDERDRIDIMKQLHGEIYV